MKIKFGYISTILLFLCVVTSLLIQAQAIRLSPHQTIKSDLKGSEIIITYGSPGVKMREIWGGLVPYNVAWRAGADEATIFQTSKDLQVEGKTLKAGKYSLFMIPGKMKWKIIFNKQVGQWGIKDDYSANFSAEKNALSVEVSPRNAISRERLTYIINSNGFSLYWDKLEVPVTLSRKWLL
jgi:hypothetical protein